MTKQEEIRGAVKQERERIIKDISEHNVINVFGKRGYDNLGLLLTAEYWQAKLKEWGISVD